jgi:hypothetical protein
LQSYEIKKFAGIAIIPIFVNIYIFMKKVFLPLAAIAILAGCTKLDDLEKLADINKDMDYSQTVDVNGLPDGAPSLPPGGVSQDLPKFAVETKSKQFIEENNTSAEYLKHVKLKKFVASVAKPDGKNFEFMDTIRIYLSAPGLPEILAAHKYGIPKGLKEVSLDCDTTNLKEYILKDSVFFRVGGHYVAIPDTGSKLQFKSTFNFLANPLNKK